MAGHPNPSRGARPAWCGSTNEVARRLAVVDNSPGVAPERRATPSFDSVLTLLGCPAEDVRCPVPVGVSRLAGFRQVRLLFRIAEHGAENLAWLRRMAMSLPRNDTTCERSLRPKSANALGDHGFLLQLLTQVSGEKEGA